MINEEILDYDKLKGLIPAVILDSITEQVLMVGFMNKEAVKLSNETKKVTFFSRTKNAIWIKGETSGNYLNIEKVLTDCDNDTLLIYAKPDGPTCHTGNYSCFDISKNEKSAFLYYLEEVILNRKKDMPEDSYTSSLFKKGENRIIQKVGEEAVEVVIAAKNNDKEEIINETSDLMFHLLVMLAEKGIKFSEIVKNLESRHK